MVVGSAHADPLAACEVVREVARQVVPVRDPQHALSALRQCRLDLALVLANGRPAETCRLIQAARSAAPQTPIVVVADPPRVDQAVRFVRAGALDYLPGPLGRDELDRLVAGLGAEGRPAAGPRRFFCEECPPGVPIVGRSPAVVECLQTIRRVANSRCDPVLILGETGAGKELAARAVHWWRHGDLDKLVAVNCATLSANLLESELFGHVKGAFTGADRDKTGLFEQAEGGSIFLDEISEMPPALQAKLLRVLQERSFRKVGGARPIACSATVIASSNADLAAAVRKGAFRQDLYYRLTVFPIVVPPLRSPGRREDIDLLAEYFIESSPVAAGGAPRRLGEAARQKLAAHHWPGNVRELRNAIDRALILERSATIQPGSLVLDPHEAPATSATASPTAAGRPKDFSLEAAERELIARALQETGGQRTRAATLLGITRATLHAKLKRYDIQAPPPGRSRRQDAAAPAGVT
jgi:DNA-binding NtrC family response regulator